MSTKSVKWKARRVPGGWQGELTLPTEWRRGGPGLTVKTPRMKPAKNKAQAIAQAASLAARVANNPIVAAALPPGSSTAIRAIGKIGASVAKGKLGKVLGKLKGKGAKRLVKALKFW